MCKNFKKVMSVALCFLMLVTSMPQLVLAQTSGTQEYATKILYALDQSELVAIDGQYANDVITASTNNYSNVEVLGVTAGIRAWLDVYHDGGNDHPTSAENFLHSRPSFLTSGYADNPDTGVKNITYKVTSSNPNGFEALDISFLGRVDSTVVGEDEVTPFLAVQGSTTAPVGEFGEEGYFDNFTDLRRITETEPVADGTALTVNLENATPDYYNFGETLTLTDEVSGLKEYYINFSYVSEECYSTALTDISFAEKVPAEFSDTDKYEDYVIVDTANAKVDNATAISHAPNRARLWTNSDPDYALKKLGFEAGKYESGSLQINGLPQLVSVDPAYGDANAASSAGKSGYSFFPTDWGFSSLTFKVVVPTGRKIEGLTIDYDGNLSIKQEDGKRSATSITTYVGDSATELGLAKRFMSYTDAEGNVAKNLGTDLDTFTVEGNGKDEIWVRLMLAGGDSIVSTDGSGAYVRPDNYINKIKITAHLKSNKVSQGTEITSADYASKVLYALDMAKLTYGKTAQSDDMTEQVLSSADNYQKVEVLGVTDGFQYANWNLGTITDGDAEKVPVLTSASGVKNITYKITSSNPDGFDELDISYLAGVNSTDGSSYVAVLGSSEAPIGEFGTEDYYNNFGYIRNIVDTTPNEKNIAPNDSKDYHDYGETLVLTDAVKGLKEYYVNFAVNTEAYNTAFVSDISFTEKVKADFSDTDRYTVMTLVDADYSTRANNWGGGIGYLWQTNGVTNGSSQDYIQAIAPKTDYTEIVNVERWIMFREGNLGLRDYATGGVNPGQWGSGSFVVKLTAPEGKVFKGLNVSLEGQNTIEACAGANKGTSITASVSDEFAGYNSPQDYHSYKTGTGVVKRFYSYTDATGAVAKNTGALTPFTVVGNNKNVMYLEVTIGNGDVGWNCLTGMQIDGIFGDESLIEDVLFSGNGAFPTGGKLTAVYKVGNVKEGEEMPSKLTFILAAYQKDENGRLTLVGANFEEVLAPTANTDYDVEITGLPTNENNLCAKAFVWDGISTMLPKSDVYKLGAE